MKKICLFLLISIVLFSCSDDPMDRTIFIPDRENSVLPAYTEWGYNSFGAEYERDYFLASQDIAPCKIVYQNNQLQFSLHGKTHNDDENMVLMFTFSSAAMSHFSDLMQLNDMRIDLTGSNCSVKIISSGNETTLDVSEGSLHFKRTQLLHIDDAMNRVILSGTFDLIFLQNGFPTNLSDGRFDLGINQQSFYAYE